MLFVSARISAFWISRSRDNRALIEGGDPSMSRTFFRQLACRLPAASLCRRLRPILERESLLSPGNMHRVDPQLVQVPEQMCQASGECEIGPGAEMNVAGSHAEFFTAQSRPHVSAYLKLNVWVTDDDLGREYSRWVAVLPTAPAEALRSGAHAACWVASLQVV
jgi:hypothetical protein